MSLLEIKDLTKSFFGAHALRGASFNAEQGCITGLIGPNGAGKTTLFNVVSGVMRADGGTVLFDGRNITNLRPDEITRAGLMRTFQIARGFPRLTVLENLMLYAPGNPGETLVGAIWRGSDARASEAAIREEALRVAKRLDLTRVIDNYASDLSGGQKKLLEIGRAIMAKPKMILLDEPAAGVNPSLTRIIAGHIRELAREGTSFLIIEHDMMLVRELCDPVIVMAEGRDFVAGSFAEVTADARVQEAYLGKRRWS
jgi:ABC-type branched-subunit amino acid transport system ATPase component